MPSTASQNCATRDEGEVEGPVLGLQLPPLVITARPVALEQHKPSAADFPRLEWTRVWKSATTFCDSHGLFPGLELFCS